MDKGRGVETSLTFVCPLLDLRTANGLVVGSWILRSAEISEQRLYRRTLAVERVGSDRADFVAASLERTTGGPPLVLSGEARWSHFDSLSVRLFQ